MARMGSIYGDLNIQAVGSYEPKQTHRFIAIVYPPDGRLTGLPTSAIMSRSRGMIGMVKSAKRPDIVATEGPTVTNFLHEQRNFAQKPKVANSIEISFRDGMSPVPDSNLPDTMSDYNSMKFFYSWARAVYDPYTGKMGYKLEYVGELLVALLDPHGVTIEEWTMKNAFPSQIAGENLAYDSANEMNVTVTFQYDKVLLGNHIGQSEYCNPPFII